MSIKGEITAVKNPLIKSLKELKDASCRRERQRVLVEGVKMIEEAHASGLQIYTVLTEDDMISFPCANVYKVPRHILETVCDTKTPQGAVAEIELPSITDIDCNLIAALDGVQDPGNAGTIIRTADASGFGGLIFGMPGADPYSSKVQRAAMGSTFRMPIKTVPDLKSELLSLREKGYSIVSSSLTGAPLYDTELPKGKIVLVIGNEARGISEEIQSISTFRVKIPMRGKAESLNAAVAAGILMYELTR